MPTTTEIPLSRTPAHSLSRTPAHRGERGFSLIELMIVVVILGILFSIAIPNYFRVQENAKLAECRANQKNVSTAATVYAMDHGITDGAVNSLDLTNDGYIISPLGECPSSNNLDNDDYDAVISGGVGRDVTCLIRGVDHEWEPK
jgi:prepilin-type N-terminal cleavage/methylation domain-containing protein